MSTTGSLLDVRPNDFRRSHLHLRPEGQRSPSSGNGGRILQSMIMPRQDRPSGTEHQIAKCYAE